MNKKLAYSRVLLNVAMLCCAFSLFEAAPLSAQTASQVSTRLRIPTRFSAVQDPVKRLVYLSWRDNSVGERGFAVERRRLQGKVWRRSQNLNVAANRFSALDRPAVAGRYRYCVKTLGRRRATPCSATVTITVRPSRIERPQRSSLSVTSDGPTTSSCSLSASSLSSSSFSVSSSAVSSSSSVSSDSNSSDPRNASGNYTEPQPERVGWTPLAPLIDSLVIFVSSSEGDDANDGLSENSPVKTLRRGYALLRNRQPDWLLLKRGDTWTGEVLGPRQNGGDIEQWGKSGLSPSRPMVIGSYGDPAAPRPKLILLHEQVGFYNIEGVDNIAIQDLHFTADRSTWFEAPSAVTSLGTLRHFLLEGCLIENFGYNLTFTSYAGAPSDVWIRRNVIADSWRSKGYGMGIFVAGRDEFYIDENIFLHNAWRDGAVDVGLSTATYDASTRTLTQPQAFPADRFSNTAQNTIQILGGIIAESSAVSCLPGRSCSGRVFQGDPSLPAIDGYFDNMVLSFTSGSNSAAGIEQKIPIKSYDGAHREFTLYWGNGFSTPGAGDAFKVEVAGLFNVESRLNESAIVLAAPGLAPVSLTRGDVRSTPGTAANIFSRTAYLSTGFVTARGNIDIDGASGGFQHRHGGVSSGNLVVRAPLAITFGHDQNGDGVVVRGRIESNVVLGGRDIGRGPRAFGISLSGNRVLLHHGTPGLIVPAVGVVVRDNIVAHNVEGSGSAFAYSLGNYLKDVVVENNIAYDWVASPLSLQPGEIARGTTFRKNPDPVNPADGFVLNTVVRNNYFTQTYLGEVGSLQNATNIWPELLFSGNHYFTPRPSNLWYSVVPSPNVPALNIDPAGWVERTGETGAYFSGLSYPDPDRTIERYMAALSLPPTIDEFSRRARLLSKANWDTRFTAREVVDYVREGYGLPPLH